MNVSALNEIARKMLAPEKGLLAADESTSTIGKRFEKIQIENVEANRQAYREMLFTAPNLGQNISGVILYDETIRQSALDGRTFVSILGSQNILSGIKVDEGLIDMPGSAVEKLTKGLDGLQKRLEEYRALGATFCKWRNVIVIGDNLPTDANLAEGARIHAEYAYLCQEAGLVPIVEPEVLMDGGHDIGACKEASLRTLSAAFDGLAKRGVSFEGMVLKTNMIVAGKDLRKAAPEEVARETVDVFMKTLPQALPGQAFLSGGQGDIEATENLNAIVKVGTLPWKMSFSYGRALQDKPLKTWGGKTENVVAAQTALLHRAKMNGLAAEGKYDVSMENA